MIPYSLSPYSPGSNSHTSNTQNTSHLSSHQSYTEQRSKLPIEPDPRKRAGYENARPPTKPPSDPPIRPIRPEQLVTYYPSIGQSYTGRRSESPVKFDPRKRAGYENARPPTKSPSDSPRRPIRPEKLVTYYPSIGQSTSFCRGSVFQPK